VKNIKIFFLNIETLPSDSPDFIKLISFIVDGPSAEIYLLNKLIILFCDTAPNTVSPIIFINSIL
jgi:hypothetical protein